MSDAINQAYSLAVERYRAIGVDVDAALARLDRIPVSLHCWQGDDIDGFERGAGGASGGILATGNYPGKATTPDELRADLETAIGMIPGPLRLNIHALYAETDGKAGRDELTVEHFRNWIEWAKKEQLGLDFNPTFFSHPMAASGFTLSSPDPEVRNFWIRHGKACRRIAAEMGRELGSCCIMNTWIPDGYKDTPIDRAGARTRLAEALDEMFSEELPPQFMRDAVESKLFGIGAESCTVGSNEFYLGYAVRNRQMLTLDSGHFHPTEVISDKISACLLFVDELLLHVSRPVRWDSDHVVTFDDELRAIAQEVIRNHYEERVHIGLDYFDATINRLAAWVIGTRNMKKALLYALLEPSKQLAELELKGDFTARLLLLEELKSLPFGAVWDYYCAGKNLPIGADYLQTIREYESKVLSKRASWR